MAECVISAGRKKTPSIYSGKCLEWAGGQEKKLAIALAIALQEFPNYLEDEEELMQCHNRLYNLAR